MMRRRALRGNASCRVPQRHIMVAVAAHRDEFATDPAQRLDTMRCWAALAMRYQDGRVTGCREHGGVQPASLWHWLGTTLRTKQSTIIWSHQASRTFTLARGWHAIERDRVKPALVVCSDSCTIIRGDVAGRKFSWIDAANWLRASLGELAAWTGSDIGGEPGNDDGLDAAAEWCRDLASVLRVAVTKLLDWHRSSDLGVMRLTASGQSLGLYRHRCAPVVPDDAMSPRMRAEVARDGRPYVYPVIHSSAKVLRLERSAYYGPSGAVLRLGRVDGPIYQLDVQQCYPSLMGAHEYPARLVGSVGRCSVARLRELAREYAIVANVRICCSDYEFPVRTPRGTLRVVGSAWTCLPGPELRHLLRADCIDDVWGAALYERRKLFADYATAVGRLRELARSRGDAISEHASKIIANSLYGKFAQKGQRWESTGMRVVWPPWGQWTEAAAEGGPRRTLRSIGGWVYQLAREAEGEQSFPAVSAYVTSYARLQMHGFCRVAGLGHVYYICSDALHVDEEGYQRLVDSGNVLPGRPGKLKVASVYDWCHYYAVARYESSAGRLLAGLSEPYWIRDDGVLAHWQRVGADELITARLYDGRPLPGQIVRETTYELSESAGGRVVGADGWTYPLVLSTGGKPTWENE